MLGCRVVRRQHHADDAVDARGDEFVDGVGNLGRCELLTEPDYESVAERGADAFELRRRCVPANGDSPPITA